MRTKGIKAFLFAAILIIESMTMGYVPVNAQPVINMAGQSSEVGAIDKVISSNTAEILYSGIDGDLEWSIDSNGHLLITGNGNAVEQPWLDYSWNIYSAKVKTTGTTWIASMFSYCSYLEEVDFSEMNADEITNSALQTNVFMHCESLKCVIAPNDGFKVHIQLPSVTEGDYWAYNNIKTPISNIKEAGRYELKHEQDGDTYIYGGKDGDIYWDIDNTGVLTISGNGACVNKDWLVYAEKVKSALVKSTHVDNASYFFRNCGNLEMFSIDTTFSSGNMAGMFSGCSIIKEIDLSAMPYAGTNLSYMFMNCHALEKVVFTDSFDTQSVEYMEGMFQNCHRLSELDLTMFDTTMVRNMSYMFYECNNLTALDLSSFDTTNVMSSYDMFIRCEKLTFLDISNFTVDFFDVEDMWGECYKLSNINAPENTLGEEWLLPVGTWTYQPSGIVVLGITEAGSYIRKEQCCGIDGDLTWKIENNKLTITGNGDYEQGYWFKYRDEIETAKVEVTGITHMNEMFRECEKLQSIDFTGTDTSQVTSFFYTFGNCISLKNLDLSGFDTSNASNMKAMFDTCKSLEKLDVSGFNTSNVVTMMAMFYGCENLETLDVSNFDTSKVYDMSNMFSKCNKLEQIDISNFNTSQLVFNASMFDFCDDLKYVNAPDNKSEKTVWMATTSEAKWIYEPTGEIVTEIQKAGMYVRSDVYKPMVSNPEVGVIPEEPSTSEKLNIPEDTGTTLKSEEITSITDKIPENSSFTVTSNDPENPTVAFDGVADENAPAVDIPKTITYNGVTYAVTTVSIEDYTSKNENAKYEVTGNKVEDLTIEYKEPDNKNKSSAKIPDYSTYKGIKFKVTSVAAKAFKGNKKLKNISIASAITIIGEDAFNGCVNLKTVTVGKNLKTIGDNAFKNCKKLTKVTIKSTKLATIGNSAFYNCASLKNLTFNSTKLTTIGKSAFQGCKKLTKITLKSTILKSVGKNALKGVNKNCKIKVPKSKVKNYTKLFKNKGSKTVKVTK